MGKIKRGELYYAELTAKGSIQGGIRPVLIYSNNLNNHYSTTLNVIPLTKEDKELCVHVKIEGCGLLYTSMALLEQITTINKSQLKHRIGEVDEECLCKINEAADIQLGRKEPFDNKCIIAEK